MISCGRWRAPRSAPPCPASAATRVFAIAVRSRADPASDVAHFETRLDDVPANVVGLEIGERALDALADLDPILPFVRRDDDEDAVVAPGVAELPGLEGLVGDVVDRLALERSDDEDASIT